MGACNTFETELAVTTSGRNMKKSSEPRINSTSHPLVYEVNARVLLNELSRKPNEGVTLETIPDEVLDEWASLGFDAIWMMGVWTTGRIGLDIARSHEGLQRDYKRVLPDCKEEDVIGSPYAVKAYSVPRILGGNLGLLELRKKLKQRGLSLILDFVSNHTARDHQWVSKHPEYYVHGSEGEDVQQPEYYFKTKTTQGHCVLAFGRDPNYPGWTDTAQLNVLHPGTREAMLSTLKTIASMCDGVRCDMAMLLLTDVFKKTWGERALPAGLKPAVGEFWSEAIRTVKENLPTFKFIAEAYWDREWQLQQLGFDYTYDKKLYERLSREGANAVYDHLKAETDYQRRSVRFIENHDEQRAAHAFGSESWHFAAATIMSTVPGMALYHDGQLSGSKIKLPVQLGRFQDEEGSPQVKSFYRKLLAIVSQPVFRCGEWKLLHVKPAWHDNHTWTDFLAYWWFEKDHGTRLVVVNYAPHSGQCTIELHLESIDGSSVEFKDLMSSADFIRERSTLASKGMYFDLPGYGLHIFELLPNS
jgi:glycosidase